MATQFASVDEYVDSFPDEVRTVLAEIRRRIRAVVPGTGETISYGIPTITLDGRYLVYFAGWKNHISVYPVPSSSDLDDELAPYRAAKGTLRFRLREPIPYDLIARVAAQLARQR